MSERPYVLISCAMSVDGYIDDGSDERLLLSNDEDFDRVDEVRAGSDAILVGATTVRRDNPRLLVRSAARRNARVARGLPPSPVKVTLTGGGELDPRSQFFTAGDGEKLVYCADPAAGAARARLAGLATVVGAGEPLDPHLVLADLAGRGVRRLMVEGGNTVHTQLLAADVVDEVQLVVAPFFIGDSGAPRFVGAAAFPHGVGHRMTLTETRRLGDVVLLRYLLGQAAQRRSAVSVPAAAPPVPTEADRRWLAKAIELSRRCPPSTTAFCVGALVVGPDGRVLGTGYSREDDPYDHAEEVALRRAVAAGASLSGATVYSSLEPCSVRASRPTTCTQSLLAAGVGRVVFAWREPEVFVDCRGAELLTAAGVDVVEVPDLAAAARSVNTHIPAPRREPDAVTPDRVPRS